MKLVSVALIVTGAMVLKAAFGRHNVPEGCSPCLSMANLMRPTPELKIAQECPVCRETKPRPEISQVPPAKSVRGGLKLNRG